MQTEAGLVKLAVPQLRATVERFRPILPNRLGTRSIDLDGLVRGMYVRGLSTRDVSDLYGEAFGVSRLSKSTVSRVTQHLNVERDLEECVTCLRFPAAHHRRIRTTNRIERLTGEGRRRTKVIPRFPTERSCLTLLFASLTTASKHWRGIPMTPAILRHLQNLRTETDASAAKEAVA